MISRRKFLQGAAVVAVAPLVSIKSETPVQFAYVEPFNFYPNPEDGFIPELWSEGITQKYRDAYDEPARALKERIDEDTIQAILDCQKAMDEANVPQDNRYIWRIEHVT